MHESANVSYPFEHFKEGNVISIGNLRVKVLHTPESMSLLVAEYTKTSDGIIFTGDTLLRSNVGRLDLDGTGTPEQLYDSVTVSGFCLDIRFMDLQLGDFGVHTILGILPTVEEKLRVIGYWFIDLFFNRDVTRPKTLTVKRPIEDRAKQTEVAFV